MPEVPVEPALLGAGLPLLSDSWSVWNSVVLMATQSLHPGIQTRVGELDALGGEGEYDIKRARSRGVRGTGHGVYRV